jgi:molecular chaperone GrpE
MASDDRDNGPVRVVDRRWWARGEGTESQADGDPVVERKPTVVENLEQQLAQARDRLQEVLTEHRRSMDEFEQVKTRIRREVGRDVERGRRAILADLLEVLDNLDRAISSARESTAGGAGATGQLVRGVELVRELFLSKLQGYGVARVPALGQPFDAVRHEAVTTTPVADPAQDGVVVAVVRDGYAIGEEMLRPASVVVGKGQ